MVQLVLLQPVERGGDLREAFEELQVQGLALDVLDEHVLRALLDALLHLRFDRQLETVLGQCRNHVEVVVGDQLSSSVLGREEFLRYSWWSILYLSWLLYYHFHFFFCFFSFFFTALNYIPIVIMLLFLCLLICFTSVFTFFLTFGIVYLLPDSLHLFELLHGRPLVERFLIIEAHLFEGLPQIEQSRFALDEGEDKVPVFCLVLVAKGNVYLPQASRDPTRIGKHLDGFGSIRPVRICFFPRDEVGNHRIVHLFLELRPSLQVLLAHVGVSLAPLPEKGLEDCLHSHILVVLLAAIQELPQDCQVLLSLLDLAAVPACQRSEFTLKVVGLPMFLEEAVVDGLAHGAILILKAGVVFFVLVVCVLYAQIFRVFGAGNMEFVLHKYFSDVGSGSLSKRQQNLVDLLLLFEELCPNSSGALPSRTDFASEEVHIELEEGIPILWSLVAVDSNFGAALQDIEHLPLVFLEGLAHLSELLGAQRKVLRLVFLHYLNQI